MQTAEDIVHWAVDRFGRDLALAASFQKDGMVILDMAVRIAPELSVLTLDTGRLPPETYEMIENVREHYGIRIETVSPHTSELESMVSAHGPNLFYRDVPSRRLCCEIRKVRPLARRLKDFRACLVGLRRDQNETRASLEQIDWEASPVKIAPLAHWTAAEVDRYTWDNNVPVHPLYASGYSSIGCAPCTRAITPGENSRAGRWWWEGNEAKECGLHFTPEGQAKRLVDVMLEEVLAASRG